MDEATEQFDSLVLHRNVLAEAVRLADAACTDYENVYPGRIDRAEAIAAVVQEAAAHWHVDHYPLADRGTGITIQEYHELAEDVVDSIREKARPIVFSLANRQLDHRRPMTEEEHFLSLHSDDDGS